MKRNKIECKNCGRVISLSNISKHINGKSCKLKKGISFKFKEEWFKNGIYECPFCFKVFSKKQAITSHIWRSHDKGKFHDCNIGYKNGRIVWNKGKTKSEDERILKISNKNSIAMSQGIASGRIKLSNLIGFGKSGRYKGYWCDSSWELAFVIYNIDHKIKFERNFKSFEYEFENKKRSYFPDFIMEDGTYIEIKNYNTAKTLAKYKFFPHKLKIILGRDGIKPYLNYVINKYGKNFIELYEK